MQSIISQKVARYKMHQKKCVIQYIWWTICNVVLFQVSSFTGVPWKSACSSTQHIKVCNATFNNTENEQNKQDRGCKEGGKRSGKAEDLRHNRDQDKRECLVGWKPCKGEEMRDPSDCELHKHRLCVCACVLAAVQKRGRDLTHRCARVKTAYSKSWSVLV